MATMPVSPAPRTAPPVAPSPARAAIKRAAGLLATATLPQCRWPRAVFLFGHMRCGSTAMSNVLCSRPDISGYGEAHIAYGDAGALGRLAVNQHRRGAWRPGARHLFDKVLHSRYDAAAHPGLFDAHGLFLVRTPGPSIESIRHLFSRIGSGEYPTDAAAAAYYEERLEQLASLWMRFPAARRIGTSYEELTADPEGFLGRVSTLLALDPPLSNTYSARPDAPAPGAGDPLSSHLFTSIVSGGRSSSLAPEARVLDLPDCGMSRLEALYARLCALFSGVD